MTDSLRERIDSRTALRVLEMLDWWIFGALQTDYRATRGGGYR